MAQIEQKNLCVPIYEKVKRMILSQELPYGSKIIQEKLATQLGVSRTPLLQALQMLESDLLVESIPRRGMFVRQISVKEMIDVYFCRESIECLAVRQATMNATKKEIEELEALFSPYIDKGDTIDEDVYQYTDERFHDALIELSGNAVLKKMSQISQILSQVYAIGLLRTPAETLQEHLNIIESMKFGLDNQAELLMKQHITTSREILITKYQDEIKLADK